MFHRQTLFVLGAGGSYEAGLPVGTELAKTIQKKMDIRLGEFNNTIGSGDKDLYHKQNMLLLKPANAMPHKFVFGTGSGMSDADRDVVARELASFFTPNMTDDVRRKRIKIEHLKCAELFDYHSKSLTGGD